MHDLYAMRGGGGVQHDEKLRHVIINVQYVCHLVEPLATIKESFKGKSGRGERSCIQKYLTQTFAYQMLNIFGYFQFTQLRMVFISRKTIINL